MIEFPAPTKLPTRNYNWFSITYAIEQSRSFDESWQQSHSEALGYLIAAGVVAIKNDVLIAVCDSLAAADKVRKWALNFQLPTPVTQEEAGAVTPWELAFHSMMPCYLAKRKLPGGGHQFGGSFVMYDKSCYDFEFSGPEQFEAISARMCGRKLSKEELETSRYVGLPMEERTGIALAPKTSENTVSEFLPLTSAQAARMRALGAKELGFSLTKFDQICAWALKEGTREGYKILSKDSLHILEALVNAKQETDNRKARLGLGNFDTSFSGCVDAFKSMFSSQRRHAASLPPRLSDASKSCLIDQEIEDNERIDDIKEAAQSLNLVDADIMLVNENKKLKTSMMKWRRLNFVFGALNFAQLVFWIAMVLL